VKVVEDGEEGGGRLLPRGEDQHPLAERAHGRITWYITDPAKSKTDSWANVYRDGRTYSKQKPGTSPTQPRVKLTAEPMCIQMGGWSHKWLRAILRLFLFGSQEENGLALGRQME